MKNKREENQRIKCQLAHKNAGLDFSNSSYLESGSRAVSHPQCRVSSNKADTFQTWYILFIKAVK